MSDTSFTHFISDGPAYLGITKTEFNNLVVPNLKHDSELGHSRKELDNWYQQVVGNCPTELLSEHDAAQRLGCTQKTLKSSRHTGILYGEPTPRFVKLGAKKVMYRSGTIEHWLSQFAERANTSEDSEVKS